MKIKIQRKCLTAEQKEKICSQFDTCTNKKGKCPLMFKYQDDEYCYATAEGLKKEVEDFWNEEVEIDI